MRGNPITKLKSLYSWPEEKPNVEPNLTGWFSSRKAKLLRKVVPRTARVILELGSWHGQSTRWFLEHAPQATVVAVDTWLGSVEHVTKFHYRKTLSTLFETFLVNCWEYKDRLVPVRNTTLMAMELLEQLGIVPDVIYFDAGHSYEGLTSELNMAVQFWPKTIFVGDDYSAEGINKALDRYLEQNGFNFSLDTESFTWHLKGR